jgi:hypothetical protein
MSSAKRKFANSGLETLLLYISSKLQPNIHYVTYKTPRIVGLLVLLLADLMNYVNILEMEGFRDETAVAGSGRE